MAGKEAYTKEQMIEALKAAKGMKTIAARRIGCTYKTLNSYYKKYACIRDACEEAKQSMGDNVESTLLNQALGERDDKGGWKTEPNIPSLLFLAKTHPAMRERGYGEKKILEHSGEDGGAIKLLIEYTDEFDNDSD